MGVIYHIEKSVSHEDPVTGVFIGKGSFVSEDRRYDFSNPQEYKDAVRKIMFDKTGEPRDITWIF